MGGEVDGSHVTTLKKLVKGERIVRLNPPGSSVIEMITVLAVPIY